MPDRGSGEKKKRKRGKEKKEKKERQGEGERGTRRGRKVERAARRPERSALTPSPTAPASWDELGQLVDDDVHVAIRKGTAAAVRHDGRWASFCGSHGFSATLAGFSDNEREDAVCKYAAHIRHEATTASSPKKATVAAHLAALAAQFRRNYELDPRCLLKANGTTYKKLDAMLKGYEGSDSEPVTYPPISGEVVDAFKTAAAAPGMGKRTRAAANLSELAWTALCRPGEIAGTAGSNPHLLKMRNFSFINEHNRTIFANGGWTEFDSRPRLGATAAATASALLANSAAVAIMFETQKNGVNNQSLTFDKNTATSGFGLCPVAAAARIMSELLTTGAPIDTPISQTADGQIRHVASSDIAEGLRAAVSGIGVETTGLHPDQVHTHGLRGGGATALLRARVAEATIKDKGRWRSGAYLIYLSAQIPGSSPLASQVSDAAASFAVRTPERRPAQPDGSAKKRRRR